MVELPFEATSDNTLLAGGDEGGEDVTVTLSTSASVGFRDGAGTSGDGRLRLEMEAVSLLSSAVAPAAAAGVGGALEVIWRRLAVARRAIPNKVKGDAIADGGLGHDWDGCSADVSVEVQR